MSFKTFIFEAQEITVLKAHPYVEISDVYYNTATKQFYKRNMWDGRVMIITSFSRDVKPKLGSYDVTKDGQKFMKDLEKIG